MRYLSLLLFMFISTPIYANTVNIIITPPLKYNDGSELNVDDIKRFDICVSLEANIECDNVLETTELIVPITNLIDYGTINHIRARTVMNNNSRSNWGPSFSRVFIFPESPIITIQYNYVIGDKP